MVNLTQHPSVTRVNRALVDFGVEGKIQILPKAAHTAQAAADALGVAVGQIANSLIFVVAPVDEPINSLPHAPHESPVSLGPSIGDPVLILTSGAHRVDTVRVAGELGFIGLQRAHPELVRASTGFAIGGVAPVAHPAPLLTLVDAALNRYSCVWAAAGHPRSLFPTNHDELLRITGGTSIAVN